MADEGKTPRRYGGSDPDRQNQARQKLTADDVEERFDAQLRRMRGFGQTLTGRLVVAGVLAAIGAGALVVGQLNTDRFHAATAQNTAQLESLKAQIAEVEQKAAADPDVEAGTETLKRVQEAGSRVAALQNQYRTSGSDQSAKVAGQMDAELKPEAKNARVPWYPVTEKQGSGATATYQWSFSPAYTFGSTTVDMAWQCRDSASGALLAWAQGRYVVAEQKIDQVTWGITVRGKEKISSSDDSPHSSGKPTPVGPAPLDDPLAPDGATVPPLAQPSAPAPAPAPTKE